MKAGLFLSLFGIDQYAKFLARNHLLKSVKEKHFIDFHHIENRGIAGSLFSNCTILPLLLNLFGVVFTIYEGIKNKLNRASKFPMYLELTGSLSNLLDRCLRGSVTDFIQFPKAPWKIKNLIFNLADFMILFSFILKIFAINPAKKKTPRSK